MTAPENSDPLREFAAIAEPEDLARARAAVDEYRARLRAFPLDPEQAPDLLD